MASDPKYRPIRGVYDLFNKQFITRENEHPAPAPGIFDPPYYCLRINELWLAHIIGALEVLTQPDSWSGDDDDKYRAEQEIEKLLNRLNLPCGGFDDMQFRQTDCFLEMSTDGEIWTPIFDSSVCAIPGPQGEQGEPGEQGIPGEQGEQGEPGADGEDGQDCECPDPNPPVTPDTDDELCGIAEYIIEKMLSISQDVENAIAASLSGIEIGEQMMDAFGAGGVVQFIYSLISGIAEVTLAGYQASLTVEAVENFKCDMFCVLQETGTFDAATTFPAWIEKNRERGFNASFETFYTVWQTATTDWWNARAAIGASQPSEFCELCDCPADACAPISILDWSAIEATPDGWSAAGVMLTSEWGEDLGNYNFDAVRADFENWHDDSFSPNHMGIKFEYSEPCTISHVIFGTYVTNTNNKVGGIGVIHAGTLEKEIIFLEGRAEGTGYGQNWEWTGSPIEVMAVYCIYLDGGDNTLGTRNITSVGID